MRIKDLPETQTVSALTDYLIVDRGTTASTYKIKVGNFLSVGLVTLINGSLNFLGTGNRITGLFNGTPHANRVLFQNSTPNRSRYPINHEPIGSYPSPSTVWCAILIYIAVCFVGILLLVASAFAAPTLEEVAESPKLFAVCKAVDIASTAYLLKIGGFVESNPLVAPLITNGVFPLILISAGIYWVMQNHSTPSANIAVNAITCGVAVSNLLLIP